MLSSWILAWDSKNIYVATESCSLTSHMVIWGSVLWEPLSRGLHGTWMSHILSSAFPKTERWDVQLLWTPGLEWGHSCRELNAPIMNGYTVPWHPKQHPQHKVVLVRFLVGSGVKLGSLSENRQFDQLTFILLSSLRGGKGWRGAGRWASVPLPYWKGMCKS